MKNQHAATAHALARFDFYKDRYRTMVKISFVLAVSTLVLAASTVTLALRNPEPRFFATNTEGQIVPLTPLDRPSRPTSAVLTWTTNAITKAYTFDFANYRQQLQDASSAFTTQGWNKFVAALEESKNLEAVKQRRLVATATPAAAPVLLQEGRIGNLYGYRINFPMLVTYQSASEVRSQTLLVTALVVRVPTVDSPEGIGIEQIIAEVGSSAGR